MNLEQTKPFSWLRLSYHGLAWLSYVGGMMLLNADWQDPWFTLGSVLIHTLFLMALVYLNMGYLLPRYFGQQRFGVYFFWLFFYTLAATPLQLLCLYWQMSGKAWAQYQLIQNQALHWFVLLLGTLSSTAFKITKEWLQQQRIRKDLETRNLQSELSFLRAQIHPHFLFNTLNSIYALALQKSDKAPDMILRLSEMLRYMLYECSEPRVPLDKEIQYIRNYLTMEHLRHGDKARIYFESDADHTRYPIAPLLLSPFLENSFKHGLDQQIEAAFVEAELYVEQGVLEFTVRNSKRSEPIKQKPQSGGIGLTNLRRRLQLLYPNAHELEVKDLGEMYVAYLKIHLI
jgi:hypothetical protein